HDPDSFVRSLGKQAFKQQIQEALPLSQFLLNEISADKDLNTAEGRARTQFDAKPLLQAMPPSALRLQIMHGLAQATQTTAAEIEALFELTRPVAPTRAVPARGKRMPPIELERQVMRLLLMHPLLVSELDETTLAALIRFAPDGGTMLLQLIE